MTTTRRNRLLSLLAVLTLGVGALAWGLAESPAVQHAAARSLRTALGPPTPPPLLIPDEPPSLLMQQHDAALHVIIPDAAPEPEAPPTPVRKPVDLHGVSFVLLLGADNRTANVTGRTDTMMIAAFRHRDGDIAVFSVPRDLWVPIPDVGDLHEQGHTHARISSMVRLGEVRLGEGQGLPLLRQTLHEQLGVRIDRYASVDFAGFTALVDEVGGIDVDVECPIMDCFWTHGTDQPCEMLSVEAGRIAMDGETALEFVRSRHGTGDHDRTKRQQAVMIAFARKLEARGLGGLRGLWAEAEPYVSTDLSTEDAAYYGSFALETEFAEIGGFAIRGPMTSAFVTEDKKHVMLLDRPSFDLALASMFERELPANRERTRCPAPDAALR